MDQQSISVIEITGARGKRSKSIHNLVRRHDVEISDTNAPVGDRYFRVVSFEVFVSTGP